MDCRKIATRLITVALLAVFAVMPSRGVDDVYSEYRSREQTWVIGNRLLQAAFQLAPDGRFRYRWLYDAAHRKVWRVSDADPSSPVNLTAGDFAFDENTAYRLSSYSFEDISSPARGVRFSIGLTAEGAAGEIQFEAEIYTAQPFLRYRTTYTNTASEPGFVTHADMLRWNFQDAGQTFRDFFVGQWKWAGTANFEPHETDLSEENGRAEMLTGAYADDTAWRALRDNRDNGLIAAWEFNGRALADAEHVRDRGILKLDAEIMNLNHRVDPGDVFRVPDAFIGVFQGDWDEAGYRTQRFADTVLAFPMPDPDRFPYVMFDTWGYEQRIDENVAMTAAARAAEAGAEVFTLDLGWARSIGDWYPDPYKFPNGIKPLSNYVHSLGMKFGLHIAFLEADPHSPVMTEHPDWEAADPKRLRPYFGATALCPSHKPAREWIISELTRIIRDYGVDWVTQDGENMVKFCESTAHTHAAGDSNYSNAVDGLDEILREVQKATPGVLWENCEDGGNMQTFHMIQQYATSIINDSDNALTTRQGVYGATYPFPPRYTDRYMLDDPSDTYHTRSYLFGGPFILMNRITGWSGATTAFVKREVELYKFIRGTVRDAKIYHITPPPDESFNDAIEAYDPVEDRSFIFVYGAEARASVDYVRPRGLNPKAVYSVNFLEVEHSYITTGQDLMQNGIPVIIHPEMAEVVAITPR